MKRVIILIADSFGIGNDPLAKDYGDDGSNTYRSISEGIKLPMLASLGLNNIKEIDFAKSAVFPNAYFGSLQEKSIGKDTTTGHFELAGIVTSKPFPVYTNGFPSYLIKKLEKAFGIEIIGNVVSSGTKILEELGDKHIATGKPIVYTSADSVLQIACHKDFFGLERLYEYCKIARKIMTGKEGVARIIARPFLGESGNYFRTQDRKDFALEPIGDTMLDIISRSNRNVIAVGKISDIYAGRGITRHFSAYNNAQVASGVIQSLKECSDDGLIFANFVDSDMLYGHRNDVVGYRECIEVLDGYVAQIIDNMKSGDLLIFTADHGCDPATLSTDHSRERVPLLIYGGDNTINDILSPYLVNNDKKDLGQIDGFDFVSKITLKYLL